MGSGIPELENRVPDYDVIKPILSQIVPASLLFVNFLELGILNKNKISELSNSEILSLFDNLKISSYFIKRIF